LTFTIALPAFSLTLRVAEEKSIFVGGTANVAPALNKSAAAAKTEMLLRGERPIDFLKRRAVIFFVFIFLVEAGLLNCINCNPVPRGTRNHPHEALWRSGLPSADSGLQLDLEIALNGVSAKIQPLRLIQPCRR
jgi:hypothetical protein